ncbi:unnamed protein product [Discula destructiva]
MTGITLYDAYIPYFISSVKTLDGLLLKAEAHAEKTGIDADAEYTGARLIADMLPLAFQIQTATKHIQKSIHTLTGAAPEEWERISTAKSLDVLHARLKKALELLESVTPEQLNGREDEVVDFPVGPENKNERSTAKAYLGYFISPNVSFHVVTAYNILRSKGVPLGKMDYFGPFFTLSE